MDLEKIDKKALAERVIAEAPSVGNADRARRLAENQQRLGGRDMGWGRTELCIPELDYYLLTARYPDLVSPDAEIQRKAWIAFLATSQSEIYKVNRPFVPGVIVK